VLGCFCSAQQVCARSSDSSFVAGVLRSSRRKGTGSVIPSFASLPAELNGQPGLINSAQTIGASSVSLQSILLALRVDNHTPKQALPISPFISDRFGRRATLFVGATLMLAGVILQWAATSIHVFIGSRVISQRHSPDPTCLFIDAESTVGFGLCFSLNAAPLLITELAYPTQV
jgi:MFS family permease